MTIGVAIIGADSTHVNAFSELLREDERAYVCALYDQDIKQAEVKQAEIGGYAHVVTDCLSTAIKNCDLVFVMGRFADSHYGPLIRLKDYGLPVFVDKPFLANFTRTLEVLSAYQEASIPITSFSPLRFCKEVAEVRRILTTCQGEAVHLSVGAPLNCTDLGNDPRLDSPLFYGIHGADILVGLLGSELEHPRVLNYNGVLQINAQYSCGRVGSLNLLRDMDEQYTLTLHTKEQTHFFNIDLNGTYYRGVLDYLFDDFFAGKMRIDSTEISTSIELLTKLLDTGNGDES